MRQYRALSGISSLYKVLGLAVGILGVAGGVLVAATPGKGIKRIYTDDDARVLLLVSEMKRLGNGTEQIHAALKAGQRADLPSWGRELATDTQEVYTLRTALRKVQVQADEMQRELQTARLNEARAQGERDALKRELDEARKEIILLNIQLSKKE